MVLSFSLTLSTTLSSTGSTSPLLRSILFSARLSGRHVLFSLNKLKVSFDSSFFCSGMDIVSKIERTRCDSDDKPVKAVVMQSVTVA